MDNGDYLLKQQHKFEASRDKNITAGNDNSSEATKQLLLASTVILGVFSVILSNNKNGITHGQGILLFCSLFILFVSIFAGIIHFIHSGKFFSHWAKIHNDIVNEITQGKFNNNPEALKKRVENLGLSKAIDSSVWPMRIQVGSFLISFALLFYLTFQIIIR